MNLSLSSKEDANEEKHCAIVLVLVYRIFCTYQL